MTKSILYDNDTTVETKGNFVMTKGTCNTVMTFSYTVI